MKKAMRKIEVRQKQLKLRKNFFLTLILIFAFWIALGFIVYFVDPEESWALPLFFILLFFAFLFTASTIFVNTRRGIIATGVLTLFLILRYVGVGHILNLLLLIGLGVTIELYLSRG